MKKKYFSPPAIFCFLFFLVFPVCISYQLIDPFITPRVVLTSAGTLVLTLLIIIRKRNISDHPNSVIYAFVILLLLMACSITQSLNPGDAWYDWLKTASGLPVLLLAAIFFREEKNRIVLLKYSQISILILSSVYYYQWIYYLSHESLDFVFDLKQHIASTLGNKNFYAEFICLMFPFSGISFFVLKQKWKWLALLNMLLMLLSLVVAASYAASGAFIIAACAVGVIYYSAHGIKKNTLYKYGAVSIFVIAAGIFSEYRTGAMDNIRQRIEVALRFSNYSGQDITASRVNSNSTYERLLLWRNSADLIRENPLRGCGAANWKLLYPKFGVGGTRYIEEGNVHYEHPHNDYLLIAAEDGIPAVLVFVLMLSLMIAGAVPMLRKNSTGRIWHAGILFAILCFAIISFFSFPRQRFYGWIFLCIWSGVLLALQDEKKPRTGKKEFMWLAMLCLAISAWTFSAALIRFVNETHSKLLQVAKKQMNFARMIREADKASSFYFPVDESATPLTWYKGMANFYSGDMNNAKAAYEDAVAKNPYHIQALNDFATSCEQSGDRERAIGLYRRALQVTPYFPHSLLNISACYFNVKNPDSAYYFIDKLYGIRLGGQEKKSYDTFLPAILRQKISAEPDLFPGNIRDTILSLSADTSLISGVYREARKKNMPFEELLRAKVR